MSIRIYQLKDHSIPVDQSRYTTSIVTKYLDTSAVKAGPRFYKTIFPYDMIFTKYDAYTSDEKVDKLNREYQYSLQSFYWIIYYLISTRVGLSFSVHKLANFSSNPGKVHFEGLLHILRYIRDNKTLGLKFHADMNDAPVSEILRQASIKAENQFLDF